jgi:hypothetical protein
MCTSMSIALLYSYAAWYQPGGGICRWGREVPTGRRKLLDSKMDIVPAHPAMGHDCDAARSDVARQSVADACRREHLRAITDLHSPPGLATYRLKTGRSMQRKTDGQRRTLSATQILETIPGRQMSWVVGQAPMRVLEAIF